MMVRNSHCCAPDVQGTAPREYQAGTERSVFQGTVEVHRENHSVKQSISHEHSTAVRTLLHMLQILFLAHTFSMNTQKKHEVHDYTTKHYTNKSLTIRPISYDA